MVDLRMTREGNQADRELRTASSEQPAASSE
jgi:hypothetical protein